MKPFTVIGLYVETGRLLFQHVMAESAIEAARQVANEDLAPKQIFDVFTGHLQSALDAEADKMPSLSREELEELYSLL